MYGRYGTDELNLVLMILGIIVMFLSRVFWFWPLAIISYALYIYALFRMFSRNIPARQKEYYSFLKVWTPVQKWFRIKKTAFRERKQYKYSAVRAVASSCAHRADAVKFLSPASAATSSLNKRPD